MNIERDFLLFHSRRLDNVAELNHSDNLYLLSQEHSGTLTLHSIYSTHPLNKKELIDDIIKLMENQ
jgi:hypothetical protein